MEQPGGQERLRPSEEQGHVLKGETSKEKNHYCAENVNESRFVLPLFKFSEMLLTYVLENQALNHRLLC